MWLHVDFPLGGALFQVPGLSFLQGLLSSGPLLLSGRGETRGGVVSKGAPRPIRRYWPGLVAVLAVLGRRGGAARLRCAAGGVDQNVPETGGSLVWL